MIGSCGLRLDLRVLSGVCLTVLVRFSGGADSWGLDVVWLIARNWMLCLLSLTCGCVFFMGSSACFVCYRCY